MTPIRDVEMLPSPLGEDGEPGKLKELLALNRALQSEKDARYTDNRDHTKKVKHYEQAIQDLMDNTAAQVEMRPVNTEKFPDPVAGTIRKVRLDTDEVMFDRPMTSAEREEYGAAPLDGDGEGVADPPPAARRGRKKKGAVADAAPPHVKCAACGEIFESEKAGTQCKCGSYSTEVLPPSVSEEHPPENLA